MTKTYPISNKKPNNKQRPYHAAGVIQIEGSEIVPSNYQSGVYEKYSPDVIKNWIPQYNVVPYSRGKEPKPLSAAQIQTYRNKSKSVFMPRAFMNQYQDLDYMVLQDIYANSIAGRIADKLFELIFGNGIKPILKLREPEKFGDIQKQQEEIEKHQYVIDKLLSVDDVISDPENEDSSLETEVNSKFMALAKNAFVFGRCAIVKEFLKPVKLVDGSAYPTIPNVLKVMHPRDLGIVEIDPQSWKLESVQIRFTSENIKAEKMIYLENAPNNPVFNSLHYGYSGLQSMIGASRSLKQMIEIDFPTITKHLWAGLGFLFFRPEGTTQAEKDAELNGILSKIRSGRLNGLMIDPDNVSVNFQDFQPKIDELVNLGDFLIRYNISQIGMPQALFAQEKDSNRATLIGKLRFFMQSVVKSYQDWITRQIAKQWYSPNFRAIYGDKEEFKKFKIDCVFEPLKLENFMDTVDAVAKLNQIVPLTTEAIGQLTDIDEFESKIDTTLPRNTGSNGIKLKDSSGNDLSLENG